MSQVMTEKEWQLIFAATSDVVLVLARDHIILDANPAAAAAAGYSREALLGRKCFEIFHCSDGPPSECPHEKLLQTNSSEFMEMEMEALGGFHLVTVAPIFDAEGRISKVVHLSKDITKRKKQEKELRRNNEILEKIFSSLHYHIALLDRDCNFVRVNRAYAEAGRLPAGEYVGRNHFALYPSKENEAIFRHVVETGEPYSASARPFTNLDQPDRGITFWDWSLLPLKDSGDKVENLLLILLDVTEKMRNAEELRRREVAWQNVMDFISDALCLIDLGDRVITANRCFYEMTGLTPEQSVGGDINRLLHPEGETEPCPVCLARGERRDVRITLEADDPANFTKLPIEVMVKTIRNDAGQPLQVLMGIHDLTAVKKLQDREERYRLLVETAPFGIQENDTEGIITFSNVKHHQILGYEPGELVGLSIWHSEVSSESREKLREYLHYLVREQPEPSPHFARNRCKDGSIIDVRVDWNYKRSETGEVIGFISIISDVTEQKQLESRLRQAQKMEAIGTLAGGIAHDFNNILSPIFGYTDLALSELPSECSQREYLQEVKRAAGRAKELVAQILAFSRRKEQERKPMLLGPLVKEAMKLLRASIPTTIEIRQQVDTEAAPVLCDATQMHQILMNLCTNAYQAMQSREGLLEVVLESVSMHGGDRLVVAGLLTPGEYAHLLVRDTGVGIAASHLERIFEPYFTTKEEGRGTGLGLSVVHGIVTGHGGAINVESELGIGTTFHVYLPFVTFAGEAAAASDSFSMPRGSEHILVVEDEEQLAKLLQKILEKIGYRVTVFVNSTEALQSYHSTPDAFDLVITDQTMPGMTGAELSRQILAVKPGQPILLYTGYSEEISEKEARALGVQGFLLKPITPHILAKTVRSILDRRGSPPQTGSGDAQ